MPIAHSRERPLASVLKTHQISVARSIHSVECGLLKTDKKQNFMKQLSQQGYLEPVNTTNVTGSH